MCLLILHCVIQLSTALEGFEKSLGLDPNDPLIPAVLFLGVSGTIWYNLPIFLIYFHLFFSSHCHWKLDNDFFPFF